MAIRQKFRNVWGALFLVASVLLALAWVPLFLQVSPPGGFTSGPTFRHTFAWISLTGLEMGLAYLLLGEKRRYALPWLFPGLFMATRMATMPWAGFPIRSNLFLTDLLQSTAQGYLCAGVALIPFGYLHVALLRWLDDRIAMVLSRLDRRKVRHLGFGLASVLLVGAHEAPGLGEANRVATLGKAERKLDLWLPPNSEVLFQDYESLWHVLGIPDASERGIFVSGGCEVWIRSKDRVTMPKGAMVQFRSVPPTEFEDRLAGFVLREEVAQTQGFEWMQSQRIVRMAIFRTAKADYVRYLTGNL